MRVLDLPTTATRIFFGSAHWCHLRSRISSTSCLRVPRLITSRLPSRDKSKLEISSLLKWVICFGVPPRDRLAPDIVDTALVLGVEERATVRLPPKPRHYRRRNVEMLRRWSTFERHDCDSLRGICRRVFVGVSDRFPVGRDNRLMCFCIAKPNRIAAAFHGNLPDSLLHAECAVAVNHPFTVRGTVRAKIYKRAVGQLLGVVAVGVHPPNLKTPRAV